EPDLRVILSLYWPALKEHEDQLHQFGELAGGRAYQVAYHVDHDSPPVLVSHDLDGNRIDRVRLCPEHAALLKDIAWINRPPYQGGSWLHHFALAYLLADPDRPFHSRDDLI
ncbi:MAG: acyl-CoA dehydrogenase family protein, partial [Anaerolineales bacterium]